MTEPALPTPPRHVAYAASRHRADLDWLDGQVTSALRTYSRARRTIVARLPGLAGRPLPEWDDWLTARLIYLADTVDDPPPPRVTDPTPESV